MSGLGSEPHRTLIGEIVEFYNDDPRVRAVAVFGSVAAGTWHELSDVDLDVVIEDGAVVVPAVEVEALFGSRAAIVLASEDSADVVLDSLEEISIRWHPLMSTSPNISSNIRVLKGSLSDAEVKEAARANRIRPNHQELLDALVRDAIGAWKALRRGDPWSAAAAVEKMRGSLLLLRGRRDTLKLDPGNLEDALARVLAETRACFDLGSRRNALLDRIGTSPSAEQPAFGDFGVKSADRPFADRMGLEGPNDKGTALGVDLDRPNLASASGTADQDGVIRPEAKQNPRGPQPPVV